MATFTLNGYNSYSGCDIVVTARLNIIDDDASVREKVYTLGSLQTLSVSTHQDKKSVRVIGSVNALDYTMGPRTIAGSLVFAVFDQHFATEMFSDLAKITDRTFFLPDELPAIDLTITFANEYGRTSRMAIYGVRIINEGQVMSVNDLYTENTYQFVANAMEPLTRGTGSGLNSDKKEEVQVTSAFNYDDMNTILLGEEIYNYSINNNDNANLNRILLNVEIDQPNFEDQEGIATFSLSPIQETGIITIYNQLQDKVEKEIFILNKETAAYDVLLKQGLYSAWYENNGKTLSNTVVFSVDKIGSYNMNYNDSPIIEDITSNSIKIVSNNPTHTFGVCLNTTTNEHIEIELSAKKCTFKNLNPNTTYALYTKHNNSTSKNVQCKTLCENETFIDSFKTYVKYNSLLLNDTLDQYEGILANLKEEDDFLYTLSKENTEKANELIFMGIKYKNEFNQIINEDKIKIMPTKNLDNVFGNTVIFDSTARKANLLYIKNKKEYFIESTDYPVENTYDNCKVNTLHGVVSISENNIKSPKYLFYNFADNYKHKLESIYSKSNQLSQLDLSYYASKHSKKTMDQLKCLAVIDNKNIDMKLLKAPHAQIDEYSNLIIDVLYKDCLGEKNNKYYVCISDIDESLDDTSFRKILINDNDSVILANKYETAINQVKIFALWIEDENYNVISDIGFVSAIEEIQDLNLWLAEEKAFKILSKIDNLSQRINLSDLVYSISDLSLKNIYYKIANTFIDTDVTNLSSNLFELFKLLFNDYYINQEKYKKVIYRKKENTVEFESNTPSQLVNIKFKKNQDVSIEVHNKLNITIDNSYDYNLLYLISNNPSIKSGFVLIDKNNNIWNHSILIEEV